MGQAIQDLLGTIVDGFIYHASGQAGVICQELAEFLNQLISTTYKPYPELEADLVKESWAKTFGCPYNASFYPDGNGFYCPSISLKSDF